MSDTTINEGHPGTEVQAINEDDVTHFVEDDDPETRIGEEADTADAEHA